MKNDDIATPIESPNMMKAIKFYLISLSFLFGCFAYAQTTDEVVGVSYIVQPGDTLYEIAKNHMEDPRLWLELAEAENVRNPRMLQPGRVITLPADLLRHTDKYVQVAFQRGDNKVTVDGALKPLTRGMSLTEGQTIYTGDDGFVSLELPDGSRLYLSANTVLTIKQFRYVPDLDKELIDFVLEEGHVETSVRSQPKSSRFRVTTPLMVTGVRGTQFGVSYDKENQIHTSEVIQGSVGLETKNKPSNEQAEKPPQVPVVLDAGNSARLTPSMTTPVLETLLPAPDLSSWPQFIHDTTWAPSSDDLNLQARYSVRVLPKGSDSDILFESRGAIIPVGPFLEDGDYIIQVRALDENGIPGYPATHIVTVKTKPEPPLLQLPQNGAYFSTLGQKTLSCTNIPHVQRYMLQLSQDEQFSSVIREQFADGNCLFTPDLKQQGVYYWRVAALDQVSGNADAAQGKFSAVGFFEVVPTPLAPIATQKRQENGVALHWADQLPGSEYVIEISDSINFKEVLSTFKTKETQAFLDVPSKCYALYVRMHSISPEGLMSDYSSVNTIQGTPSWCTEYGAVLVDGQGVPITVD